MYGLMIATTVAGGTLLSGGGSDHTTLDKCKAEWNKLFASSTGYRDGKTKVYCVEKDGKKLQIFP